MSIFDTILPPARKWARVGDFFEVTRKPRDLDMRVHSSVPFVTMDAVPQGGRYEPKYDQKPVDRLSSGTYFERGDLLIAKITPSFENGKQALADSLPAFFGYATTEVIPLRCRLPGHDKRLLFFYLLHPEIRSFVAGRMEGATGRQRVPESVLLDLPYPEIPAPDQRIIADALERICHATELEIETEDKALHLKQVAMRELFTRGLSGEGPKETEIGAIPASWTVHSFSQVREWLQYGTSVHCTVEPKEFPVLRIPNVEPGRVNTTILKYCDLPEEAARKYLLEEGDLLFIRTNGVLDRLGSCAVYCGEPQRTLFASYLIRARLRTTVDPYFVAYFYGSQLGTSLVAGRATPAADGKFNLNTGTIDSLPLPLPPTLEEQHDIVAVLKAIDRKISLHQRKRAVLNQLFRSALHKLMTGEIFVEGLAELTPESGSEIVEEATL